jgi:hypothetical protein
VCEAIDACANVSRRIIPAATCPSVHREIDDLWVPRWEEHLSKLDQHAKQDASHQDGHVQTINAVVLACGKPIGDPHGGKCQQVEHELQGEPGVKGFGYQNAVFDAVKREREVEGCEAVREDKEPGESTR